MELSNQKKLVQHIFRLLKVNEIVIPIGRTNKGNLGIKFQANSEDFEIYLDAVPLSTKDMLVDDNNIELKKMLDKYLFPEEKSLGLLTPIKSEIIGKIIAIPKESLDIPEPEKKKRGRPVGAKNKVR